MRPLPLIGLVFGAITAAAGGAYYAGYRVNVSDSLPPGVWQVRPGPVQRGSIVLICPPDTSLFQGARRAKYIARGACPGGMAPLLKPVAAVAGDRVAVSAAGIRVNGSPIPNTARLGVDGSGRFLPSAQDGESVVPAGQIWLLSSYNKYSFDSRYFGPLAASRVSGVARPVYLQERRS